MIQLYSKLIMHKIKLSASEKGLINFIPYDKAGYCYIQLIVPQYKCIVFFCSHSKCAVLVFIELQCLYKLS